MSGYRICTHEINNLHRISLRIGGVSASESNFNLPKSGGNGPGHDLKIFDFSKSATNLATNSVFQTSFLTDSKNRSTSPPGGNQVDGLPPALSLTLGNHFLSSISLSTVAVPNFPQLSIKNPSD